MPNSLSNCEPHKISSHFSPWINYFVGLMLLISPLSFASSGAYETRLIESLSSYQQGGDKSTEAMLRQYIVDYPNSQSAHLMLADLLASRSGLVAPDDQYKKSIASNITNKQLDGLRDELNLRWNQLTEFNPAKQGLVPASILKLDKQHRTALFVDTKAARLYVFNNNNGSLEHVNDYYITIGLQGTHKQIEGDEKTPIGVYHVTSFIPDEELPPLYGTGAFPINYPNIIDKRHKRTGYGIWIHGTHPESFNRVPYASNGCVALSNPEFTALRSLVDPGLRTPVVISDDVDWIAPSNDTQATEILKRTLFSWQTGWESLDTDKYLNHYSKTKFKSQGGHNYRKWATQKRQVGKNKTRVDIGLTNISLFTYPSEKDMVVVDFNQHYQSNNFESESSKRQYWQKDQTGDWKIIYEGKPR
ncbi:MAG: murein L,D-transpeptidase YafK [Saprospiraceae bacterium]|jgi:murein L,D-transpeptidase YafK